jgi:hypothetical protein
MGLLSKAGFQSVPEPPPATDEMGNALRDRILRIPAGETAADTALNLLKAYASFHAGICFSRSGTVFTPYASTGIVNEKLSIPCDEIDAAIQPGMNYAAVDVPELKELSGEGMIWIFLLDAEKIHYLLLAEDNFTALDPQSLYPLIKDISKVLIPSVPSKSSRTSKPPVPSVPSEKRSFLKQGQKVQKALVVSPLGVTSGIKKYHGSHAAFQGIVVEMTDEYSDSADFAPVLSTITASLGEVLPLPSRFCLVLVPGETDRELLAHRLSKSLKTRTPFQFRADSPDKALKLLHAYL